VIIAGARKYIETAFSSEQELERVVQENAEYIFGPDCLYLPKSLIRTPDGSGTIPDGFVVDLASRSWFIVEAELAAHNVWNHIAPQVAKQIIASSQPANRRMLTELVVGRVKESVAYINRFEELGVSEIDIRRVLSEIFENPPIIGMPIDAVSLDLREWALTLKVEVRLWVVRKLVEFGNADNVIYEIPDEYKPVLDTSPELDTSDSGLKYYDVTVADLLSANLLKAEESLFLAYKPRGGERRQYEGRVTATGAIEVMGKSFTAPSYAALLCVQNAGSERDTVNGWIVWKTGDGKTLADLRDELLSSASTTAKIQ
jgi:Restriction Enzyme Adenine Methylase Associated